MSAAVPGLPRDMLAFTAETIPSIMQSLDFLNVMTYDLMNRRDNVTKHHAGIQLSLQSIDAYIKNGAAPEALNLGFAFYRTESEACRNSPIGCPTLLMEDPETGADLGRAGAFAWADDVPADVKTSFQKSLLHGEYDSIGGGHYYWDAEEALWWSFETPESLTDKFSLVAERRLGGGKLTPKSSIHFSGLYLLNPRSWDAQRVS
jgi:GH18 family chitinase